ncbi:MAG: PD-(D/E)XK nuclease family protein, partial [Candidatus Hadarchaeales archaeon]
YRRYAPFDQGKTLALEHKVTINIGGYKLKGFIDRLAAFPDGLYEIHDYKTSRTLPAQPQLDADRQLALYQIGIQQQWEDVRRVDLVWHYLFHDKELRSKRTEEQLEELKREVLSVIHQIERAEELDDFPPRRDYCQWCEFQGVCPEWSHERRVLELPRNEFMKEPGVRLVDQYAEVKRKAAELAELEKKLREAIVAYAKREGVTSIRGSNCRLYVRIEKSEKFPGAREEGREELEEVIKEAGRWEEVSMLDVRALAGVVRRAEWPAELLEKLRPFQRLEESVQLRLGKLKEEE